MEVDKRQYGNYVKEKTPAHSTFKNVLAAFVTGGLICTAGQLLLNGLKQGGLEKDAAAAWTLLILIFTSVLLTGCNLFQKLACFCGAGILVPITGFANSVASPAMEYRAEGMVFGVGCKIFTIAGPVILYGVLTSWALGVISMVTGFGLR